MYNTCRERICRLHRVTNKDQAHSVEVVSDTQHQLQRAAERPSKQSKASKSNRCSLLLPLGPDPCLIHRHRAFNFIHSFNLLHHSLYIVWTRVFLKTYTNSKLHPIPKQHTRASEPATTYKMTLMYLLVIIHINNQSALYKVNGIVLNKKVSKSQITSQPA
jgi:hypothetical protein